MQIGSAVHALSVREVHRLEMQRQSHQVFSHVHFKFLTLHLLFILSTSFFSLVNTVRNERIKRKEDWILSELKMNKLKKKYTALEYAHQTLKGDKEELEQDGKFHYYHVIHYQFQLHPPIYKVGQYIKEKSSMQSKIIALTKQRDALREAALTHKRSDEARSANEGTYTSHSPFASPSLTLTFHLSR
jgi:hypothetical protein